MAGRSRQETIDAFLSYLAGTDIPSLMGSRARRVRLLARQLAVASDLPHGDARTRAYAEALDEARRIHEDLVDRRDALRREARAASTVDNHDIQWRAHKASQSWAAHAGACPHAEAVIDAITREAGLTPSRTPWWRSLFGRGSA